MIKEIRKYHFKSIDGSIHLGVDVVFLSEIILGKRALAGRLSIIIHVNHGDNKR